MASEQLNTDKPREDYPIWTLVRYIANNNIDIENEIENSVPSFSAIDSLLSAKAIVPTFIAFAPILPYPATEFYSIYTCMINFQDILLQKKLPYEVFWCDENVCRISKELQLLLRPKFDNLFIGIRGFHTEKVPLVCCGLYLKDIGVRDIFVNNEIYGPVVADYAVLSRGAMRKRL